MKKYAIKEVFDIEVYGKDGLLFKVTTAKEVAICRDFEKRESQLIVEDALVDLKLANDILNGKYDNKYLRIKGRSIVRDVETGLDRDVFLNITVAKLSDDFMLVTSCDMVSTVTLTFNMPTYDAYGFMNINFEVR